MALAIFAAGAVLRQRGRSWRWLLAGLILPALSALFVTLALAHVSPAARSHIVLLLDFSPSTSHAPWRDPAWVQAQVRRHVAANQQLSVVAFASQQSHVLLQSITPADPWPALWDWEPLSTSAGVVDVPQLGAEDTSARWVITDGLLSTLPGDANIAWTIVPPERGGTGGLPDAAICDLQLRAVGPGQLEVLVKLRAVAVPQPMTARVVVTRDEERIADQAVEFPPATAGASTVRWLSVIDHLPTDRPHHYAATIAMPNDAWPQNDRGAAVWPGTGALRTLIVSAASTALPGTTVKPDQFRMNASQLAAEGWQVVALNDIPAEPEDAAHPALSLAAARALDSFVRDDGGGLVLLSGTHAFGPGRYGEGSPTGDILEQLSPVASHPPQDNLSVLFLLDASSSMNDAVPGTTERKVALLARAVQSAAAFLAPDDAVTVVTFNAAADVLAQGKAEEVVPKMGILLAAVQPAGTTNPDAALPAVKQCVQLGARRLVIFVTDGEIPAMNVVAWRELLQTASTHVAIIAPRAAAGPLAELAGIPNATWSQTENPGAWAEALRQSILSQTRGTVQNAPLAWRAEGMTGTSIAWTRTWRKPEATAVAAAPGAAEVPVASIAQRGLGKVAALTIADDGSVAYQSLRDRLVQAVAAGPGDRRFTITASRAADGRWRIAADGVEAEKFLDGQKLALKALGNDPAAAAVPLPQTAPGHYETLLPAGSDGFSAVIVRQEMGGEGQLVARVQAPAVETTEWPATVEPPELPAGITRLSPNDNILWSPAARTGLTPWLWTLAAVAALAALWVRKS